MTWRHVKMANRKCQYLYLDPANLVPKTFTADFWKSVKNAGKSVCCQVGHYTVVQYQKRKRHRWHFTWVKYHGFEKETMWKRVSPFLWQCFKAFNSRADMERKECNNILLKLLQILLTFRDVGRWNQTVRGTILSKGHLKDSILEYKWIYSSQLWIT